MYANMKCVVENKLVTIELFWWITIGYNTRLVQKVPRICLLCKNQFIIFDTTLLPTSIQLLETFLEQFLFKTIGVSIFGKLTVSSLEYIGGYRAVTLCYFINRDHWVSHGQTWSTYRDQGAVHTHTKKKTWSMSNSCTENPSCEIPIDIS